MVATINAKDGLKSGHRKEKSFYKEMTGLCIVDGKIKPIVVVRFYGVSQVYGCVWVNCIGASGSAGTSGGGYHKSSAAAYRAFASAGITFDEDFDGGGQYAIEEAITAVCTALGYTGCFVHNSHA